MYELIDCVLWGKRTRVSSTQHSERICILLVDMGHMSRAISVSMTPLDNYKFTTHI